MSIDSRSLIAMVGLTFLLLGVSQALHAKAEDAPRLEVQSGHSNIVNAVAYSPNGRILASASGDRTVKIWEVATGKVLRVLAGHANGVNAVAFSPDGQTLASGSDDRTVKLWEIASGKVLFTLAGHGAAVKSVAFSPDGHSLASGSEDGAVKFWSTAAGNELRTLAGHTAPVWSIAFSADGRMLASGSEDTTIKIWEASSGKQLRSLTYHSDGQLVGVHSVAFSPDGHALASGNLDGTVKLWDVASGKQLQTLVDQARYIASVSFSPDGGTLAISSGNYEVELWSIASGKRVRALVGHDSAVNSVSYSPDGLTLASGANDFTIKLWDTSSGKEVRTLTGNADEINSIAFSPDGRTMASASWDKAVKLWDLASGRELRMLAGHTEGIMSVIFSPDGRTLASASWDKTVKLWDTSTGKVLRTLVAGHTEWIVKVTRTTQPPSSVAFSADGQTLALAGPDTLELWDVASGKKLRALTDPPVGVNSVAFSPDGRTLASGDDDNRVVLWDVSSGKCQRTLNGHTKEVRSVVFSPDGRTLASASWDGTIKLWDVATGEELRTLTGHSGWVNSLAFSPDGHTLASASEDTSLKLWDVASGKELRTITGHASGVETVAFAPDGRTLASGSGDHTIRLWRISDGSALAALTSFGDGSWAVTDEDGRFDASNGGQNSNLQWVVGMRPISPAQLKSRYYEPFLLEKAIGSNLEPLRAVPSFKQAVAHLFPQLQARFDSIEPLQLNITLADQGGGYGKVRVRLNGKEITEDARAGKVLSDPKAELKVQVPLNALLPGDNLVDVVAWNAAGSLSSPAEVIKLSGVRGAQRLGGTQTANSDKPTLFAIVMGVAHFHGPGCPNSPSCMDLAFSGKDAHDFAQAIRLGGNRLFGIDHVQVQLLSDYEDKDTVKDIPPISARAPTKDNLRDAFAQVASQAKPRDLLVVFLAGHGVMTIGDDGDYYYLTSDAQGLDLSEPAVRPLWGVSSSELTDWIKQVHANKQMMVLDTCASGGALQRLAQQRGVPSSQVIALDRLKDRTGFYVLAGAAADRVSYETTRFGQGLLTRALLAGMKGAALRDGEFIDVARLFQYARDEVPELAKEIGGLQAPLVAAPLGDSFDVGRMLMVDQEAVPLAKVREMMVHSTFQDEEQMADLLKLSIRLNQRLRLESAVNVRGQVTYIDADDFPDAWQVAGRYRQSPEGLTVSARLFRNGEVQGTLDLTLTGNENEQDEQLFTAVMKKMNQAGGH